MNNEEIIEKVLREKNLEDDNRLIWALVNSGYCKTIVEASEEVDYNKEKILKKALAMKDAEHLEFLENYMKELTSTEAIIQHEVPDYFPLDDLKKRLRIEISLREFEGEEK